MTALNKLSIPQLISRLNSLGVEWVGSTTRKALLIDTINLFAYNADYLHNDKEAEMTVKGLLKGLNYPVCNLVGLLRYWNQPVTSDEVADPYTLQQRVLEIARQKYPPAEPLPSLDKVLGYSMEEFSQMPLERLSNCCKTLDMIGVHDKESERCETLICIKSRVAYLRRETSRDLRLDTENCQWAFKTSTATPQKLPDNIWCAKEGEKVRHNQTFYSMVVKGLRQRGFYEPDIHHTGKLEGIYLCCKLEDKPAEATSHEPICESILRGVSQSVTEQIPSFDKVLSYSWEYLKQLNHFQLMKIYEVLGYGTYGVGNEELLRLIKSTVVGMRRRPERDLVFDPAGCQYVYESKTGYQHKIAEDMRENPTNPLYHALVLQDLKQRGFYEPDCVTDTLHGLYLVCDLADAPRVYLKPGDRVKLNYGCESLLSFTRDSYGPNPWFNPGDVGTVETALPTECIVQVIRGGAIQKFRVNPKDLRISTLG